MSIAIECQSCRAAFQVGDNLAGKRVRCRNCQAVIAVQQPCEALDLVASIAIDEPPSAAPFYSQPLPDLSPPPLPGVSMSPLLGGQAAGAPLQWGGTPMYAQRHSTSLFGDPYLAGLAAFGMVWGGFALCESVDHCREVLRSLRFEQALVWLPALVCLLVLIMQTACLGIIIAAFAGTIRRYSWGAPFGFVAAVAITGLSFAWTPILSSLSGLGGFLYHLFDLGWRSLIRNSLRLFVDVSVFLIVPAYLVFAFRGQMDSALRRDQPRALLLVLAAGTLGWSVHALLKVFLQLSALYTVLDFAGMNASLPLRFWMAGLGKMGCLVAVLVLLAAGAGMFLRQPWAIATALFASAAFLAIELVFLIVEIMPRENGMPVGFGGHLLRGLTPLIIPGILCGLSIYLKDEE